ncbi:hypothetical protein [Oribacterium sp. WCC10]|uniref:hypothetical protein n=1 Tax=Oribacterium sp. WCC10 TaxID=1855343 RepID=UPI001587A4D6|nr:hypothetical protein [Oribacterium sp. WCC10]
MCQFLDIELHENCSFIYKLQNMKRETFLAEEYEEVALISDDSESDDSISSDEK